MLWLIFGCFSILLLYLKDINFIEGRLKEVPLFILYFFSLVISAQVDGRPGCNQNDSTLQDVLNIG